MTVAPDPNRSYLHPACEVRPVGTMRGVFTREDLPKGTLVTLWGGQLVTVAEWRELPEERRHYFVYVEEDWLLGPVEGSAGDQEFFNHSCDPNCGMSGQIGLVTRRPVSAGEELTFDYSMAELVGYEYDCGCGTAMCRGRIREGDALTPDLRARYAGYFSPWIQRAIDALEGDS